MTRLRRSTSAPRRRAAAIAMIIAFALPQAGGAADYSLGGSVRFDADHDDNIRLLENDGASAFGQTLAPSLEASMKTRRFEASLDARLRFLQFNRSEFDTDDQTLLGNLLWRGERSETGLIARWVRDSTLTSERLDSGRVGNAERRETYVVQPSWTYYLTERNLLTFGGAFNDTRYQDDAFVDYRYGQASLRWTHVLNQRLHLLTQVTYADYQSADRDFAFYRQSYAQQTEDIGLQFGAQYQWSEQFSANALVGLSRSELRYDLDDPFGYCSTFFAFFFPLCRLEDSRNTLSTLDASLDWQNERHQLAVSINRSTQPSSDGQVLESTQLRSHWTYRLWKHGDLLTGITLGRHGAAGQKGSAAAERSERDFAYASLGYRHRLTEAWSLDATYRYRYQDYDITPSSADSHTVSLGISYRPRTRHWSR